MVSGWQELGAGDNKGIAEGIYLNGVEMLCISIVVVLTRLQAFVKLVKQYTTEGVFYCMQIEKYFKNNVFRGRWCMRPEASWIIEQMSWFGSGSVTEWLL